MLTLLAQTTPGEWHDGWWILIAGVCVAVVGWLLRVLYSGLKDAIAETKTDLNKRCDTIETSLSELRNTLLTDALERARQQPQTSMVTADTVPAATPAVSQESPAGVGFATASTQREE